MISSAVIFTRGAELGEVREADSRSATPNSTFVDHLRIFSVMAIHLSGGAAIGAVILEGKHAPFRALACPLQAITMGSDESLLDSAQSRRARRA